MSSDTEDRWYPSATVIVTVVLVMLSVLLVVAAEVKANSDFRRCASEWGALLSNGSSATREKSVARNTALRTLVDHRGKPDSKVTRQAVHDFDVADDALTRSLKKHPVPLLKDYCK